MFRCNSCNNVLYNLWVRSSGVRITPYLSSLWLFSVDFQQRYEYAWLRTHHQVYYSLTWKCSLFGPQHWAPQSQVTTIHSVCCALYVGLWGLASTSQYQYVGNCPQLCVMTVVCISVFICSVTFFSNLIFCSFSLFLSLSPSGQLCFSLMLAVVFTGAYTIRS